MNRRVRIETGESEAVGGERTEEPEAIHLLNDLWSQFIMGRNATQPHTSSMQSLTMF